MANITRQDPYGELVEDLFKGFFVRPASFEAPDAVRKIRIEVAEQDDAYKVRAELPGVKKDDIQVTIEGDQVSISAEIKQEREAKEGERVLHSERYFGKVQRVFRLGQEIDQSKVSARYADGVLELVLPKKSAAERRQITIN
jgi:HSP20 family protein